MHTGCTHTGSEHTGILAQPGCLAYTCAMGTTSWSRPIQVDEVRADLEKTLRERAYPTVSSAISCFPH